MNKIPNEKNIDHVQFDYQRKERIGLPEAVFCEKKRKKHSFIFIKRI